MSCEKRCYSTRRNARNVLKKLKKKRKRGEKCERAIYFCKKCRAYHLTSLKQAKVKVMELEQQIKIINQPAVININFEALKLAVEQEVARYKTIVTEDNLADTKKAATEINKLKGSLAEKRKEEYKKATAEADLFKSQMQELETICENSRQDLLQQVAIFDNKKEETVKQLIEEKLDYLFSLHKVESNFRNVDFDDLIKTSNLTEGGKLTRAAMNRLETRVFANKDFQQTIEKRLLNLKVVCFEAGLEIPLERQHIEHFLYLSEELFVGELDKLINAELERQDKAKKKREENQNNTDVSPNPQGLTVEALKQAEPCQIEDPIEDLEIHKPETKQTHTLESGMVAYKVICEFRVEVPDGINEADLDRECRKMLKASGMDETLKAIYINQL